MEVALAQAAAEDFRARVAVGSYFAAPASCRWSNRRQASLPTFIQNAHLAIACAELGPDSEELRPLARATADEGPSLVFCRLVSKRLGNSHQAHARLTRGFEMGVGPVGGRASDHLRRAARSRRAAAARRSVYHPGLARSSRLTSSLSRCTSPSALPELML